jgi:ligand-binding SRPBCC domain-containing protein
MARPNLDLMEWTGQVYADAPTAAAEIRIDAPPERVWDMVSDIFLMPQLSSELQAVAWLDGDPATTGPAVGRRFTGRTAHPAMGDWETVSTVTECDPPRRFAWAVGDPAHPSSTWRFTLKPDGAGTLLGQWPGQLVRVASAFSDWAHGGSPGRRPGPGPGGGR